jgi:sugar transferase EpsL
MTMGRPVLFRQSRGGWKGRPFLICKFRTMTAGRVTRLGGLLRRSSIDELPQLWNILKGEMSLVGPRPLLASYLDRYDEFQRRRHEVRPGLTGWAQVQGRNAMSWEERFELDAWYARNWTLGLDLMILARTVASVLRADGIDSSDGVPMREFLGNHLQEGKWTISS